MSWLDTIWNSAPSMTQSQMIVATACTLGLGYILLRKLLKKKMDIRGKTCLIIGASSGIGEELAHQFVKEGCKVILTARRVEKLNTLKQTLIENYKLSPTDVHVLYMDVSDHDGLLTIMNKLISEHCIDIMVFNAGILLYDTIEKTSLSMFKRVMDVNYFGAVVAAKALLPAMRTRKSGSMIFISSLAGKLPSPTMSGYGSSKHAMHAFVDALRAENADTNLHVLLASPGLVTTSIATSMIRGDGSYTTDPDVENSIVKRGFSPVVCAQTIVAGLRSYQRDLIVDRNWWTMYIATIMRSAFPNVLSDRVAKYAQKSKQRMQQAEKPRE